MKKWEHTMTCCNINGIADTLWNKNHTDDMGRAHFDLVCQLGEDGWYSVSVTPISQGLHNPMAFKHENTTTELLLTFKKELTNI